MSSTLADTQPTRHSSPPLSGGRITASSTFGAVTIKGLPAPGDLGELLVALFADADVRDLLERSVEASRALAEAGGTVGACDGVREGREIDAAQAEVDDLLADLCAVLAELEPVLPPVALTQDQAIALRSVLIGLRLGQGAAELRHGGLRSK